MSSNIFTSFTFFKLFSMYTSQTISVLLTPSIWLLTYGKNTSFAYSWDVQNVPGRNAFTTTAASTINAPTTGELSAGFTFSSRHFERSSDMLPRRIDPFGLKVPMKRNLFFGCFNNLSPWTQKLMFCFSNSRY